MLSSVTFLTPLGALVAIGALPVLAAGAVAALRVRRVNIALGLPAARRATAAVATALTLAAVPALLGVAAAQPVAQSRQPRRVRTDTQVFFVVDISRSMLASSRPGSQTRFEAARAAAERLRGAVPDLAVGVASMTDRVLPLLFPSADEHIFQTTIERALQVDAPPPLQVAVRATTLAALTDLETEDYFPPSVRHRVVVVFTDGESAPFPIGPTGRVFRRRGMRLLIVRVGSARDRVYGRNGVAEPGYTADPHAAAVVGALAAAAGGGAYDDRSLGRAAAALRDVAAGGPRAMRGREVHGRALAPYAAAAAFIPLVLLLWQRNLAR
jgi:hypothetical protein